MFTGVLVALLTDFPEFICGSQLFLGYTTEIRMPSVFSLPWRHKPRSVYLKKSAAAVILLALLGGAAYWLQASDFWQGAPVAQKKQSGQGSRAPLAVEMATARTDQLSDDISAIGSLVSEESVDISAETNGRIVEILFADGAQVKTGEVLFRLDDTLVKAVVADAEAKLALAKTVFERNEALFKTKNIAQSVFDQTNTELTLAESALALAKVQLGKLTIRAPFSGRAGFRSVSVGAYVQAGAPLVHVEKIDLLKAAFSVPELYFPQLGPGQSVEVTADALPGETFEAKISAIDPLVDINGRALRIRADLENSAEKLRPGMLIRISVRGPQRSSVTVPESAIVPRGNGAVVFIAAGEKAREAKVRTGKRSNGAVEILEGVKAGEQVITAGNTRLSDGAAIAIVPATSN
jgi:membrane fusion protein, multidrug efflux system